MAAFLPTPELVNEWASFLKDSSRRLFKIGIKDDQLQPAGHWMIEGVGSEDAEKVFALFDHEGVVTDDRLPAAYVIRLSSTKSDSFLFVHYVPANAQLRSKMLFAASRKNLLHCLDDSKFADSIYATCRDDLTYSSYLAHTKE